MKTVVKLLGVAALLSFVALLPASVDSAPGYCNNPGQCASASNKCTCPPGTPNEGLITTCANYFAGICDPAL